MNDCRRTITLGIILLCEASLSCSPPPPATTANAAEPAATVPGNIIRVEVIRPERKTIRQIIEQPAQLKPYEETPVFAKLAGYVRSVNVDLGDRVQGPRVDDQGKPLSDGQVLLQLSVPELEDDVRQKAAAVAQMQASVAQAQAAIQVAEAAIVSAESAAVQAEAAVKRTEADCSKWQSQLKRFVDLAAKGAVTDKLVDETRDQLAAADASHEEAHAKRKVAAAVIVESQAGRAKAQADLVAARARVDVAEAEHARAFTMLQYGTLRAPYNGFVTRRNVHTGHMVQAGSQGEPLLVLMRSDILRVQIDVPEGDSKRVVEGAAVSIRVPALDGEAISGKVARIAGALDANTRTLRVEAHVANQTNQLRPGLYAYATIVVAEHANAIVLPTTAVLSEKGQNFCLCVAANQLVRKPIEIGLRTKTEVEIAAGLQGDESVVRVNSPSLAPGQPVEASPYAPPK